MRGRISKAIVMMAVVMGFCIAAVTTVQAGGSAVTVQAGKLVARPMTPQNLADAGMTNTATYIAQKSAGLITVGKGQPVYLEAQVILLTNTRTLTNGNVTSSGGAGPLVTNVYVLTNSLFGSPGTNFVDVYADRKITTTYTNITGGTVTSMVNVSAYAYYWPQSITNVTWSFGAPGGSAVTFDGPLFTNCANAGLEIYNVGERNTSFVPTNLVDGTPYLMARKMFIPDVEGVYAITSVVSRVVTKASPYTLGSITNVIQVNCATYRGEGTCAACHQGATLWGVTLNDNWSGWAMTAHADALERKIDGGDDFLGNPVGTGFNKDSCISCHSLGYDTNSLSVNDGFDDMAKLYGWTTPLTSVPGNWAAMPLDLKRRANIQCESCHGPGSLHNAAASYTEKTNSISVDLGAGVCGSCHDSVGAKRTHYINAQWRNSPHGSGRYVYRYTARTNSSGAYIPNNGVGCDSQCHSAKGFIEKFDTSKFNKRWGFGNREGITCVACHDPHQSGAGVNEHQIRTLDAVPLGLASTVPVGEHPNAVYNMTHDEAGAGILCINCHRTQTNALAYVTQPYTGSPTDEYGYEISMGTMADMIAGVNGIEYGGFTNFTVGIPMHLYMVGDTCVGCHMNIEGNKEMKTSKDAVTSNSFLYAQGHTMHMKLTNGVDYAELCQGCHGRETEEFDFVSSINVFKDRNHDYDGDGVVEGVQTEVRGLLNKVAMKLGAAEDCDPVITSASTLGQRKAAWNYNFVKFDKSYGVHNSKYAVALLKASYNDLLREEKYSPRTDTYDSTPTFIWPSSDGTVILGVTNYTLTIKLNGVVYRTITGLKGAPTYTPTLPLPGGTYEWKVGNSEWVSFRRLTQLPGKIVGLAPIGFSPSTLTTRMFAWAADTNGQATKYNLYVKAPSGVTATYAGITTTNVAKTVAKGTNQWWVVGVGPDGLSATTQTNTFIVPHLPGMITTLTPTNNATSAASSVKFTWLRDTNLVATSYQLMIKLPAGAPGYGKTNIVTISGGAVTNYTKVLTSLVPAGLNTCQWWMRGRGAAGYGPSSVTNDVKVTK